MKLSLLLFVTNISSSQFLFSSLLSLFLLQNNNKNDGNVNMFVHSFVYGLNSKENKLVIMKNARRRTLTTSTSTSTSTSSMVMSGTNGDDDVITNDSNFNNMNKDRRTFLGSISGIITSATVSKNGAENNGGGRGIMQRSTSRLLAAAYASDENDKLTNVYFGVGCFWHIQHEFVEAERNLLGRSDEQLTSRTGYAGGIKTDKEGRVCYHNLQGIADYGKLGHGEVVGMTIPESKIGDFAVEYFNMFAPNGERVDPGDRGGEYRSLIGLPGGTSNPMYSSVEEAASAKGMTLQGGKGNDPDTFGKKLIYVYDTTQFPFYQAEVYHQFHNDFQSPPYGKVYNNLANVAFDDGRITTTGCPDRV